MERPPYACRELPGAVPEPLGRFNPQEISPPPGFQGKSFPVHSHMCDFGTSQWQCKSAVLVHSDMLRFVSCVHTSGPHPAVVLSFPGLSQIAVISAHLPHGEFSA
eukprot:965805-Heterocapsa_arctica.AAC.1